MPSALAIVCDRDHSGIVQLAAAAGVERIADAQIVPRFCSLQAKLA
jgi:hypothetical protein